MMAFNETVDQYISTTPVVDTEMNKRQNKLVENDLYLKEQVKGQAEQIQILNERFYGDFNEVRTDFDQTTDLSVLISAMSDNSRLVTEVGAKQPHYPTNNGQLIIEKTNNVRVSLMFFSYRTQGKDVYRGEWVEHTSPQFLGWVKLATTEKTEILCTANTGFIVKDQYCYAINNAVYITATVEKTDGGAFSTGLSKPANIPSPYHGESSNTIPFAVIASDGSAWNKKAVSYVAGSGIRVLALEAGVTSIRISGVITI